MSTTNNCLFVLGALGLYYYLFMSETETFDKLYRGGVNKEPETEPEVLQVFRSVPPKPSRWFSTKKDLQQKWF